MAEVMATSAVGNRPRDRGGRMRTTRLDDRLGLDLKHKGRCEDRAALEMCGFGSTYLLIEQITEQIRSVHQSKTQSRLDSSFTESTQSCFAAPTLKDTWHEIQLAVPSANPIAPPSYEDTLLDTPPDYTATDTLAKSQLPTYAYVIATKNTVSPKSGSTGPGSRSDLLMSSPKVSTDFSSTDHYRTHGKKKKVQTNFSWDFDGDDKKKNGDGAGEGGAGDGNGNAGGSGGAAGAGGDGNNGGEDDWNDWSTNKKKNKKGKKQDDEEEKKKKEEAEAAKAVAEEEDDWAGWGSGKKNKAGTKKSSTKDTTDSSNFQDISLNDDTAPKLDFDFGTSKDDKSSALGDIGSGWSTGLGGWGATSKWSFGGIGSDSTKKDDTKAAEPWGSSFGKKKDDKKASMAATSHGFDFELGNEGTGDLGSTKKDDDEYWGGFSSTKNKKTLIEDLSTPKEAAEPDDSWGGWGSKKSTTKKSSTSAYIPSWEKEGAKDKAENIWGSIGSSDKKTEKIEALVEETSSPTEKDPNEVPYDEWHAMSSKDRKKAQKSGKFCGPQYTESADVSNDAPAKEEKSIVEDDDPNMVPYDEWNKMAKKERTKAEKSGKYCGPKPAEDPQPETTAEEPDTTKDDKDPNEVPFEEWKKMTSKQKREATYDGKYCGPEFTVPVPDEDAAGTTANNEDEKDPNEVPYDEWQAMSNKDRKKATKLGKFCGPEPSTEVTGLDPEPEPTAEPSPPAKDPNEIPYDDWIFMNKKARERAEKQGKFCGPNPNDIKSPSESGEKDAGMDENEPDPNEVPYDKWQIMSNKEKKAAEKSGKFCGPKPDVKDDPIVEPDATIDDFKDPNEVPFEDWQLMTKVEKRKAEKAGKFCGPEPVPEPVPEVEAEPPAEEKDPNEIDYDRWNLMTTKDQKKAKKDGKFCGPAPVEAPAAPTAPEVVDEKDPNEVPYDEWHKMTTKDQKRAEKKGKFCGPKPDDKAADISDPLAAFEPLKDPTSDWTDAWGTTAVKKSSGLAKTSNSTSLTKAGAAIDTKDDDWMNKWLDGDDDKKKAKGVSSGAGDTWGTSSFGSFWKTSKDDEKEKKKDPFDERLGKGKIHKPDEVEESKAPGEDDWLGFTTTTSSKDKKKKKNGAVEVDSASSSKVLKPDGVASDRSEKEEEGFTSIWGSKSKTKKKGGLKVSDLDNPTPPGEKEEPLLDKIKTVDTSEDIWSSLSKKDKDKDKDKKSSSKRDSISKTTSKTDDSKLSKSTSKDSKSTKTAADDLLDLLDDPIPPPPISKDDKADESPAAATRSMWSSWGSTPKTSTSKTTTSTTSKPLTATQRLKAERERKQKEQEEKAEQERLQKEEEEKKKKEEEEKLAAEKEKALKKWQEWQKMTPSQQRRAIKLGKEEPPKPEGIDTEDAADSKDDSITKIATEDDEKKKPDSKKSAEDAIPPPPAASASSWGSMFGVNLKSTKKASAKPDKAEGGSANQLVAITEDSPKAPEASTLDDATSPLDFSTTKSASSKTKTAAARGSVADRIKELEKKKKDKKNAVVEEAQPPPPPPPPVVIPEPPVTDPVSSSKVLKKSIKESSSSSSKKKKAEPEVLAAPDPPPKATSPLPGLFPGDEDDYFAVDPKLAKEETMGKSPAVTRKSDKKTKKSAKAEVSSPSPVPEAGDEGTRASGSTTAVEDPSNPLTPPLDDPSGKKDRAKVVRNGGSSWGLWGASTKSNRPNINSRPKLADDPPPTETKPKVTPPAQTRVKSSRKAIEKDAEARSSESDKAEKSKGAASTRPKSQRASTGFSFFSPAPPQRSKSTKASKTKSQEESEDLGVITPPPEEESPRMNSKAAKVMGVRENRKSSSKAKDRRKSMPDPYAMGADLLSDTDPLGGPVEPTEKRSSKKSKRQSVPVTPAAGDLLDLEDLDEGGPVNPMDDTPSKPKLQRAATASAAKPKLGGGFMGLFGMASSKRDSRAPAAAGYESEGGNSRQPRTAYEEQDARRARRKERRQTSADEAGLTDAAAATTDAEADARRAARRARRAEREQREREDAEAKKAAAKETRDREVREEEEREIRKQEERKARRAAREERRAAEDRALREQEAKEAEKRAKRRDREDRPKNDRRRSSQVPPAETDDERRARKRAERRSAILTGGTPYLSKGGDKTSSWVDQLNSGEPPLPPPVEGTVLEPPPDPTIEDPEAEGARNVDEEERIYREMKRGGAAAKPSRPERRDSHRPSAAERERERERDPEREQRRRERKERYERERVRVERSSDGSNGAGAAAADQQQRRRSVAFGHNDSVRPAPLRKQSILSKFF